MTTEQPDLFGGLHPVDQPAMSQRESNDVDLIHTVAANAIRCGYVLVGAAERVYTRTGNPSSKAGDEVARVPRYEEDAVHQLLRRRWRLARADLRCGLAHRCGPARPPNPPGPPSPAGPTCSGHRPGPARRTPPRSPGGPIRTHEPVGSPASTTAGDADDPRPDERPDQRPAPRPRLPAVARPGAGIRGLRRPDPPHRLLHRPRPRRRRTDRTGRDHPRPLRQPTRERVPGLLGPVRRRRLPPPTSRARRGPHQERPRHGGRAPRAFLTLTAPSFGPVHTRKVTARGHVVPCGCGERHHGDDPRLGGALDPTTYDYDTAVLWQAHAGALWARFTTTLRRALAHALGVPVREFTDRARLSYAKVAEYQRRGLVHFHAVIRLDGPDGPTDPPPAGLARHDVLRDAITTAARSAVLTTTRPDGSVLELAWGAQLDLRPVTSAAARHLEDADGHITDAALAGYIAKYATKGTGATEGTDRPIRDGDHIAHLDITPHHRRMIETAWRLGGRPEYAELRLRRWAHMLGFRGHFLTKSRAYSVTFGALRAQRRVWRLLDDLDQLGEQTDDPGRITPDADTVTVINDWAVVRIGHRDHAERELAVAIAERNRTQRRTTRTVRRAA